MKKECFKCGETKSLDDFYTHPKMADGHLNKCKECVKRDVKERVRKDPEKRAAYERERAVRPSRKKAVRGYVKRAKLRDPERYAQYQRDHNERHPEHRRARVAVSNAIRDGRIVKQSCKGCGKKKGVQAHHRDYSKPLVVRWLCPACHGLEHRKS